ncbi:LysE family translocator [Aurantimicrobium minutum]|jgi:threonine/homoserine/homoserine lactone efflux protein|uniref:LysE family translocator n=1 Tax=Aurantimicrobium minutum TaxID=708131 RepID=UPI002476CB12|nr:LysE family translocator [Aurantimicrobium minutum]MDH6239523.1 threonine/homoserine/homoserine lactone efflux protein [Aurantimicrobium minutum]
MILDLSVLPAFLVSALVIILSPGADTFLMLRSTLRGGKKDGFLTMLGIYAGITTLSLLLISGVGLVVAKAPGALFWLKILGALYLLFLAVQSLRAGVNLVKRNSAGESITVDQDQSVTRTKAGPFVLGFLTNVTNPKVLIFFLAFFPQFLGDSSHAAVQLAMLCLIFVVVSAVWLVTLVFAASAMRKVMTTTGFTIAMEFVVATVFAVLAITLLFSGLSVH